MTKKSRLQKTLDDLELEQAELTERQKELEVELSEIKRPPHTDESDRRRQQVKGKLSKIQKKKATLNRKITETRQELRKTKETGCDELRERFEDVVDELTEVKTDLKNARKELEDLRGVRDKARSVVETFTKAGIGRTARDAEEDKNLYSSTSASLWTGDLWNLADQIGNLQDALD